MTKKIISIVAILLMCVCVFAGCPGGRPQGPGIGYDLNEEEQAKHIRILTEKTQAKFFNQDGTGNRERLGEIATEVTGFEVMIIKGMDGTHEWFLIEFLNHSEPVASRNGLIYKDTYCRLHGR